MRCLQGVLFWLVMVLLMVGCVGYKMCFLYFGGVSGMCGMFGVLCVYVGDVFYDDFSKGQDSCYCECNDSVFIGNLLDVSKLVEFILYWELWLVYGNKLFYIVFGYIYCVLLLVCGYVECGIVLFYGNKFYGYKILSLENYDMYQFFVVYKMLLLFSYVWVINLVNGKSVIVCINDCGLFYVNWLIDFFYVVVVKIGIWFVGIGMVEVCVIDFVYFEDMFVLVVVVVLVWEFGVVNLVFVVGVLLVIYLQVGVFFEVVNVD